MAAFFFRVHFRAPFLVAIFAFLPLATYCLLLTTALAQTVDKAQQEAALEAELKDLNQEITGLNNSITGLKSEGASLSRDIKLLNANINRANLNIKAKNIQIGRLGFGIEEKVRTVRSLDERIAREKQSLAQLIRKTNEIDNATLPEMLLSTDDLSDFFLDLDSFDSLRSGLKNSADVLRGVKAENESARAELEDRQAAEMDAKADLEKNKRLIESNEKEKQRLLSLTKNKEKEYGKVLADSKKRAAEIRAALFALRDSGEIPFGQALDYANTVSSATGVRPAFILAILMQESSFGKNQGSCYLRDRSTGSGVSARTGNAISRVMNPSRDTGPFLEITGRLGRDSYNTRVSCPQEAGWGGAMGPAQFIPSTWIQFENRIRKALGSDVPDPWNPRDAFMAAGMYLSDLGANKGTYSAERDAACRYFSGKKCSASSWATTYGTQVMQKASNIQENMIDPLQNT